MRYRLGSAASRRSLPRERFSPLTLSRPLHIAAIILVVVVCQNVRHHARYVPVDCRKFHLREDTIESRTAQAMAMRVIVAARRVTSRRPAIDDPPFAFAR